MAKVYVGTYKKYNEGDLSGKWINLSECETYDAFLAECHKVHSDERDPEFMIQDSENFPDGLDCMEWLSRKDFDDVKEAECESLEERAEEEVEKQAETPLFQIIEYSEKALAVVGDTKSMKEQLKALGGRFNPKLSCGAGWVFSKAKESELRALLAAGCWRFVDGCTVKSTKTAKDTRFKDWLKEYAALPESNDYNVSHSIGAIKIGDRFILLEKQSIENRFCFHDEGPDYEFYKKVTATDQALADYFIHRNIGGLKRELEDIKRGRRIAVSPAKYAKSELYYYVCDSEYTGLRDDYEWVKDVETRRLIFEGLKYAYELFAKRLETYLKRYGVIDILPSLKEWDSGVGRADLLRRNYSSSSLSRCPDS